MKFAFYNWKWIYFAAYIRKVECQLFFEWDEISAYLIKKQGEIERTLTFPIPLIIVIKGAKTH